MTQKEAQPPFSNGYWAWDDSIKGLVFICRTVKEAAPGAASPTAATKDVFTNIKFKDTIDNLGQARFRRLYQRRVKPSEPQIVTLQDIKDVAIFSADRNDLTMEFIDFLHTRKMDEFLRALIVYFQYFFIVWDNLIIRREEAARKLRQPIVTILENVVRDDLADLRSMVARAYSYILLGCGDSYRYYHMNNRNNVSLSDKDRHLHECLLTMATKIVWIALLRKNFVLIETELNRMFRSVIFNIMARLRTLNFQTNAKEDRVLNGRAYKLEKKLKAKSPAVQELVFDSHNYKMLAIGHLRVLPVEDRIAYLEAAYTAPEELLFEIKVGVGILGLEKSYLNAILSPKEGMAKRIKIPLFRMPVFISDPNCKITETLPETPPKYTETAQSHIDRKTQRKVWRKYVQGDNLNVEISTEESQDNITSTDE